MVKAVPDFTMHPEVMNGCTDLFVHVMGKAGRRGPRSAWPACRATSR